ncbi:MAG: enoyl-CoA hydratase/isomerase family protein [Dehalococcoidia bacterium]|nr:enoyl-CoA hydratase/isomerase family protein [Dehalococcoidia bacterium]
MPLVRYEPQEPDGRVVLITMDRPEKLNAMSLEMIEEMAAAWARLEQDAAARAAVLTGAGRAFCAGLDMKDIAEGKLAASVLQTVTANRFSPRSQSKPVVGAINGAALGAGLDFVAMDCDLLLAAEEATFGMPEVMAGMASLGSPFAWAGVPRALAMELFLTGDPITARRAFEGGLVNRVLPAARVLPEALALARRIAEHAPNAVRQSRKNLLEATQAAETPRVAETSAPHREDMRESTARGIEFFVKKQRPQW